MAKDRTTMVVAMTDQKSFSSFFVGSLALDSRRLVIQSAYPHKTMAPPFATISKNACMSLISFQDNAGRQPRLKAEAPAEAVRRRLDALVRCGMASGWQARATPLAPAPCLS